MPVFCLVGVASLREAAAACVVHVRSPLRRGEWCRQGLTERCVASFTDRCHSFLMLTSLADDGEC